MDREHRLLDPSSIRRFTAEVAAIVESEHAFDPAGELLVWLQMALRREASVGEIYGFANLDRRLDQVRGPPRIIRLLRTTISNIWAQEKAHAAYLEAVLSAVARPSRLWLRVSARLDGFLGSMEGLVLSGRTSPSNLQRAKAAVMLAVGRRVQDVPQFVSALSSLTFRELCILNAELEITAVHGYQRILALLEEDGRLRDETTIVVDLTRMVQDERFHNEAFVAMEGWFGSGARGGNAILTGVTPAGCAASLAAIRARVYGDGDEGQTKAALRIV
jgi:hypothetical protein